MKICPVFKLSSKLSLFIGFLIFVFVSILFYGYLKGFWPERGFICPIYYAEQHVIIRNDPFGEGHFGARRKGGRLHKGIDLEAPVGTPIRAARRGIVIETGNHPRGYGKYVEIRHTEGFVTIYAHLSEIAVREGEMVYRGKTVGNVGKSGNASHKLMKPHVHFEIRKDRVAIDPMQFIGSKNQETAITHDG